MKKKSLLLLLSFLSISVLSSCGSTSSKSTSKEDPNQKEWTIMSYIIASNLETDNGSYSTKLKNFTEKVTPNDKVNYVFEIGGTSSYYPLSDVPGTSFDPSKTQRYEYKEKGKFNKVYESSLMNMTSPYTLSSFIKWSKEKYPAKNYMLEILDHGGGGYYGVGLDIPYSNSSSMDYKAIMTLDTFESALKDANTHLSIIHFDCCLMSCIEACQASYKYADYFLANEESSASSVDTLGTRVQYIYDNYSKNKKVIVEEIAKIIAVEEAKSFMKNRAINTAIDLSKTYILTSSFNNLWKKVRKNLNDSDAQKVIADSLYLGDRMNGDYAYDITSFTNRLITNENQIFKIEAEALTTAVNDMVIYKGISDKRTAGGISFAYQKTYSVNQLDHLVRGEMHNPEYLAYLDDKYSYWNAPSFIYENCTRTDESVLSDSAISLNCDLESIRTQKEIPFTVKSGLPWIYRIDGVLLKQGSNKQFYYLGKDTNVDFDPNTGNGKFYKPSSWGHLILENKDDGIVEKTPIYQNVTSSDASSVLYSVPCTVNFSKERTTGRNLATTITTLDNASLDFDIHGIVTFFDSYNLLPDGDYHPWPEAYSETKGYIRLRYSSYGNYGKYEEFSAMSAITSFDKNNCVYFDYTYLTAGTYAYTYVITDVFGNERLYESYYTFSIDE